jgi:hypothetical protein
LNTPVAAIAAGVCFAPMTNLIRIFSERGDLAHLAQLLWAMSASALSWFALRELAAASRRFDKFVRKVARFNEHYPKGRLHQRTRRVLDD